MVRAYQRHLLLLLLLFLAISHDSGAMEIGPVQGDQITILVPITTRLLDPVQKLQPPTERWLSHIAARANLRMRVQPAAFDRRLADINRNPNSCIVGVARLPERENQLRWLDLLRRDRVVLIAAASDPFKGPLSAPMREADDRIAAPTGLYRNILESHGVRFINVDDQRAIARMVAVGRIRFGMVIRGTLTAPDIAPLGLRVVGELPVQEYWVACARGLPDHVATRLVTTLNEPRTEELLRGDGGCMDRS